MSNRKDILLLSLSQLAAAKKAVAVAAHVCAPIRCLRDLLI